MSDELDSMDNLDLDMLVEAVVFGRYKRAVCGKVPAYSSEWNGMQLVAERMTAEKIVFELKRGRAGEWRARFGQAIAVATRAPRAVCLAAARYYELDELRTKLAAAR